MIVAQKVLACGHTLGKVHVYMALVWQTDWQTDIPMWSSAVCWYSTYWTTCVYVCFPYSFSSILSPYYIWTVNKLNSSSWSESYQVELLVHGDMRAKRWMLLSYTIMQKPELTWAISILVLNFFLMTTSVWTRNKIFQNKISFRIVSPIYVLSFECWFSHI